MRVIMKLSVIMPVYNEAPYIAEIVRRVREVDLGSITKEIVLIEDGSTDGTREIIQDQLQGDDLVKLFHDKNRGKGAACWTGLQQATGEILLIQDADLEYSPRDYPKLLLPILEGRADVVYGSRFIGGDSHRVLYYWHSLGNRLLTWLFNMLNDMNFTDMETCYKVFRRQVIQRITLKEPRFGFDPEITAKICKKRFNWRIYEVGISYTGRIYAEGKKIGWRDALTVLRCILRYSL